MSLTRDFKETIGARATSDPRFCQELLREVVECILVGDVTTAKAIFRNYISAL